MGSNGWRASRIAPCDLEGHDLAPVVDGQMELEAEEPAHRAGTRWASPSRTTNLLVPGKLSKGWRTPGPTP